MIYERHEINPLLFFGVFQNASLVILAGDVGSNASVVRATLATGSRGTVAESVPKASGVSAVCSVSES